MTLNEKFLLELQVFDGLIKFYKQSSDPHATSLVLAYEHGRQALEEMYKVTINQKEEPKELLPF